MVPNLANTAKNHSFPKILPISYGNIFNAKKFQFAIFQIPIVTININKI